MATLHTIGQNTKYQTYINLLEDNAITFRKISTSPSTKTYATFENANKAFLHLYGDKDICYCVVKLDESNSENPKHFGRFIPVAIGYAGLKHGVHFDFYIVLQWNSI